ETNHEAGERKPSRACTPRRSISARRRSRSASNTSIARWSSGKSSSSRASGRSANASHRNASTTDLSSLNGLSHRTYVRCYRDEPAKDVTTLTLKSDPEKRDGVGGLTRSLDPGGREPRADRPPEAERRTRCPLPRVRTPS